MESGAAWKYSLPLKMIIVSALTLLLLIPVGMIALIIESRKDTHQAVVAEIGHMWGDAQTIGGPILVVPYRVRTRDEKNELRVRTHRAYVLPEGLTVVASVRPEIRNRGIYDAIVYHSTLSLSGSFTMQFLQDLPSPAEDVVWSEAVLILGVTDMRGVTGEPAITVNGQTVTASPGTQETHLLASGIRVPLPKDITGGQDISFTCSVAINGSSELQFLPVGKHSDVIATSIWPDPSFVGSFLPTERKVSSEGFSAQWKQSYFARSYPQFWTTATGDLDAIGNAVRNSSFGVRLLIPVDFYQQTTRCVKYAVLFIALTFVVFFLYEILNPIRIHPLQYLLVGFALCLFYLILLSVSEYISFDSSYVIASTGIIALITGYSSAILRHRRRTAILTTALMVLYGYLYVLIQLEDFALLIGSLGLFVILAGFMYLTRNINWYSLKSPRSAEQHTISSGDAS